MSIHLFIIFQYFPDSVTDRLSDSPGLLSLLNIESLSNNSDLFVTVEFIHNENVLLLGKGVATFGKNSELFGQILSPGFVSGNAFNQGMLHSLLAQVYYNRHILHLTKR